MAGVEKKLMGEQSDIISESGSESKEEYFQKVHEIDLERERHYMKFMSWVPSKLRIDPNSASVSIVNDDYFIEYAGIDNVPLQKCTLLLKTDTIKENDETKMIGYLELVYEDSETDTKVVTKFRLPANKREVREESLKFTLFTATLRYYGSQFGKLRAALKQWE
eukprot:799151_1